MIFGAMDGLVSGLGIVGGLAVIGTSPRFIFGAVLSAGLAGVPGMAAGQYRSAPEDGWQAAALCGLATGITAILPAVPFLVTSGIAAVLAATIIGLVAAGMIAWLAPDHGWQAIGETYGLLAAASALCIAGGFVPH